MHGIIMIFFFLIPSIPATLGQLPVPMMIGAKDLAFPRLNLLSWYIYMHRRRCSRSCAVAQRRRRHRLDVLHAVQHDRPRTRTSSPPALGIFITGFSSILTGLNFIVTIHTMRAPGHDLVPAAAVRLVALRDQPDHDPRHAGDRDHAAAAGRSSARSHLGIFDPALGGDPVLFQHLFWFYSHPAVYIMILPAMGVISELIADFSRKNIFGYTFIAFSSASRSPSSASWSGATTCSSPASRSTPGMIFSFLSFLVAIPSAIKVFNWTATLYKGSISLRDADALRARLHRPVHDRRPDRAVPRRRWASTSTCTTPTSSSRTSTTSWSAARSWRYLGGLHYWWPKMTGRMYPEALGASSAR